MEFAVISSRDENCSVSIWNPFTGTLMSSYLGGGSCSSHGLVAKNGYIITNEVNKPMLHAWPLNKQHHINRRLIAPGKITCVSISSDCNYIALSVDCKLLVYQTSSGVLCGSGGNHFQPINVIKFNPEGTFIACGGEDGLLTVWQLGDIVQIDQISKKPFLSLNAHSLPITDLIFTGGDLRSRVITCSLDRSCKMHDVWTKNKLYSAHFENQLTSLALCPRESAFYIGDADGHVRQISLLSPPRKVTNHYSNSSDELQAVKYHQSRVNCLSISSDCSLLLSGSNDWTIKLIHIKSHQCLQTINQKGSVTNCFFYIIPSDCFSGAFKPSFELYDFKSKDTDENFCFNIMTTCDITNNFADDDDNVNEDTIAIDNDSPSNLSEVNNLKKINDELYQFALNHILNNGHQHQVDMESTLGNSSKGLRQKPINPEKKRKRKR